MLKLDKDEYVESGYCEHSSGPGRSNWVVWAYIGKRGTDAYRKEAVQFDEVNKKSIEQLSALSVISQSVQSTLRGIAVRLISQRR